MGKLDDRARVRLAAWMKSAGKTQAELARDIGRNSAWMSRYLDGTFDTDLDTLQQIATAFGNSLGDLLGFTETRSEDAEVVALYRSLRPESRHLALQLLRDWSQPTLRKVRTREGKRRAKSL